jgi:hypothetical protein
VSDLTAIFVNSHSWLYSDHSISDKEASGDWVSAMTVLSAVGRRIDGDAFHPALVVLGIVVAVAIGWVIWEFWLRDEPKD